MASTRTFIAVHLPIELREALVSICAQLKSSPGGSAARWVAPENIHLTLKFLGDVDDRRLPEVHKAIRDVCAGVAPFRMDVAGLGCFPNCARPSIVWAGITSGASELRVMARAIDSALGKLAFPKESRPFSAHITLARADKRATSVELAALGRTIASKNQADIGTLTIATVSVVKSDLRATGPVYTDMSVARLGTRPAPDA